MGLITTGRLVSVVSADQENDYIEISRHDKTTDVYDSYKISVKNLLSGLQDSDSDLASYSLNSWSGLAGDYVDLVSEQNVTGYKKFSAIDATQATGGTASFSQVAARDLVVDSTALFQNSLTCYGNMYGLAMSACWADLAEYYEADAAYPPGTLVAFGGERELTLATAETGANAVVTTAPGFTLNSGLSAEFATAVALAGKTPVRVLGPIRKFDRIVLSDRPGVGRARAEGGSEPAVGIALDSAPSGEGLVMCATRFGF